MGVGSATEFKEKMGVSSQGADSVGWVTRRLYLFRARPVTRTPVTRTNRGSQMVIADKSSRIGRVQPAFGAP